MKTSYSDNNNNNNNGAGNAGWPSTTSAGRGGKKQGWGSPKPPPTAWEKQLEAKKIKEEQARRIPHWEWPSLSNIQKDALVRSFHGKYDMMNKLEGYSMEMLHSVFVSTS